MKCILCGGGNAAVFYVEPKSQSAYFHCGDCHLRFLDPQRRLGAAEEKIRYQSHENHVEDPRYQEFMRPLIELIEKGPGRDVLDFGCGGGPVIHFLLEPRGFRVSLYDPYFHPEQKSLERHYDFIAASEVMEHVYDPGKEFARLRRLLRPGGRLGVMTVQCSAHTNFDDWYYRRDPTHVVFYARETLEWIRDEYRFKELKIHSDRLAEFLT